MMRAEDYLWHAPLTCSTRGTHMYAKRCRDSGNDTHTHIVPHFDLSWELDSPPARQHLHPFLPSVVTGVNLDEWLPLLVLIANSNPGQLSVRHRVTPTLASPDFFTTVTVATDHFE